MDKKILISIITGTGLILSIWLANLPDESPVGEAPSYDTTFQEVETLRVNADFDCTKGKEIKDYADLSGKVVYGCFFSQEKPDTKIFPDDLKDTTFVCSHLDNVFIPENNKVINSADGVGCGSRKQYKRQNDREDWIVNAENNPIEPIEKEKFEKLGISTDPKDIPDKEMDISITEKTIKEKMEAVK
jgi:hypothetical protein